MYHGKRVALIMPARNEAGALPGVLKAVPREVDLVLVVDNGSTDATAPAAKLHGAHVVKEPVAGYGRACLTALAALESDAPDIVAFADADGSDDLSRLLEIIDPLVTETAELSLASRVSVESNALSLQQRFGNWLATRLIRLFWGHDYADLGPMRAITWSALQQLQLKDTDYGWTVEMQVRALKERLRVKEHPVPYRRRSAGRSKVSGTLAGSLRAGMKILWVITREAFRGRGIF